MSEFGRKYTELLVITLVAVFIAAVGAIWLLGEYRSTNGLAAAEVAILISGAIGLMNQLAIWRSGAMVRDVHHEVNGKAQARSVRTQGRFDQQDEQLDRIEGLEPRERGDNAGTE